MNQYFVVKQLNKIHMTFYKSNERDTFLMFRLTCQSDAITEDWAGPSIVDESNRIFRSEKCSQLLEEIEYKMWKNLNIGLIQRSSRHMIFDNLRVVKMQHLLRESMGGTA